MKRIRLISVPLSEEQLEEVTADWTEQQIRDNVKSFLEKSMFKYKDNVLAILRSPLSRDGISIEEMEKSIEILDLVKATPENGVLELENDQYDFLVQKLNATKFVAIDPRILKFVKTLQKATDTPEE